MYSTAWQARPMYTFLPSLVGHKSEVAAECHSLPCLHMLWTAGLDSIALCRRQLPARHAKTAAPTLPVVGHKYRCLRLAGNIHSRCCTTQIKLSVKGVETAPPSYSHNSNSQQSIIVLSAQCSAFHSKACVNAQGHAPHYWRHAILHYPQVYLVSWWHFCLWVSLYVVYGAVVAWV